MITISFSRNQLDYLKLTLSGIHDDRAKSLLEYIESDINKIRTAPVDNSNSALGRNFRSVGRFAKCLS